MTKSKDRQARILDVLSKGFRVSNFVLANVTASSPRTVRRDINALRRAGHNIPLADAGGYLLRKPKEPK